MVANIASIEQTLGKTDGEIETLSASSKTVEAKFNAIFSLAEQVKKMSVCLTEAMREQENGSKEVLTAIKSINTVTIEVQAGSEEMLKGGEGVAEKMQKLKFLEIPYCSKMIYEHFTSGLQYADLRKCIAINVVSSPFKLSRKVHSVYHPSNEKKSFH